MNKKKRWILLYVFILLLCLAGCKGVNDANNKESSTLKQIDSLSLQYATQFSVDYYEEGYIHIYVANEGDFVLVPEGKEENDLGLSCPTFIYQPCDHIYLAASSPMDLFIALDGLDCIAACSTKAKDFAMEAAKQAIDEGNIQYVGKYSAPDYEALIGLNCGLAIESSMIGHAPKIKEQLERLNIPVFVDRSSYEENPLGRLEWLKLYGILIGKEKEASEYFDAEIEKVKPLFESDFSDRNKSVAFFSISSSGYVVVRKPGDYVCKMIEMAGGSYALANIFVEEENALSTVNIGMEDFYREARDADILIYNGTIDGGIQSLEDLYNKNDLLKDFKAVKNDRVFTTSLNMYQESSKIVEVIYELSTIIQDDAQAWESCSYIKQIH